MMAGAAARRVVIGIGNPDRGDDGVGQAVVRRLQGTLPDDIELIEHAGDATALVARLDGVSTAYFVDACSFGAAPGTVHRFDLATSPLPQSEPGPSTHDFGLAGAVELARVLGRLPPYCVAYTIEGASFALGAPLSPPVQAAVEEVARRLTAEITGAAGTPGG